MAGSEEGDRFVGHESCPKCGSTDNFGRYADGHGKCFSTGCGYYEPPTDGGSSFHSAAKIKTARSSHRFIEVTDIVPLTKRKLSAETCAKWGYGYGLYNGSKVQVATFKRDGEVVFQKVRMPNKEFRSIGDIDQAGFYGQHLWPNGGKMLVVTEGEIDALSVSQVDGLKWPVCSVPNGVSGAAKAFRREIEWLESFETVVLMFDNDAPGNEAAQECAMLLSPGKARIARLPLKDANEMLKANRGGELAAAKWSAEVFRPDGIITGSSTLEAMLNLQATSALPFPWKSVNAKTLGIHKKEIVVLTGGTGIGKTTAFRELAYFLGVVLKKPVGYLGLEEACAKTAQSLVAIHLNKPLNLQIDLAQLALDGWPEELIPDEWKVERPDPVPDDELIKAHQEVFGNENFYLYDHWGSQDPDVLIAKLTYLVKACGCEYLFLDHLSILISGLSEGDERRLIDNVMTKFRAFVENTGCTLFMITHLTKKQGSGPSHEEGGAVSGRDFRGSGAINQLSDLSIAFERDQQDEEHPNRMRVRILKARESGLTGLAEGVLEYDRTTGRLVEIIPADEAFGFADETLNTKEEHSDY